MAAPHGMLIYNNDITPDSLVDMKGDRKITEHPVARAPNSSLFKIEKEDATLANLLSMKLHEQPMVSMAGYRVPHPTQHRVELTVQTASVGDGAPVPTPKEALSTAIDACIKDLETFRALFEQEVQVRGY